MAASFVCLFITLFYISFQQVSSVSCKTETNVASECDYDFRIYCCGVFGGAYTSSLTSFLLSETNDPNNFLSMDVGTSYDCLKLGQDNGQLSIILDEDKWQSANKYDSVGYFRKEQLNGFLVTHSHLDHVDGLIISSAEDSNTPKPIIARPIVMKEFLALFQPPLWPSYTIFSYYNVTINENNTDFTVLDTYNLKIRTFPLMHTVPSTAFLTCNTDETSCVLFLGDTGPDPVENSNDLENLWITAAPFVANGRLNTIFMESSYDDSHLDASLFGHLKPEWVLYELYVLAEYVAQEKGSQNIEGVLSDLYVVVIHIKPTFLMTQDTDDTRDIIKSQLVNPENDTYRLMGVNFIIPYQTDMIYVKSGKPTAIYSVNEADDSGAKMTNVLFMFVFILIMNMMVL